MATYESLWNELLEHQSLLSPLLGQRLVNRAWRDIRDARHWSFQMANGWLYSPAPVTAGSASVTQFSATVTLNATASTAVTGLTVPLISKRQFRALAGPIYSIVAVDFSIPTAVTLTLDRLYLEATNAAAAYSLTRIFYGPPLDANGAEVTDFLRYRRVYDPVDAYNLTLDWSADELDYADPQRSSSGQPYIVATRGSDSATQPIYELWPSPFIERGYLVVYQRRGVDLATGDSLPPTVSDELVLQRALWLSCQWAQTQTDPRFRGINWPFIMQGHDIRYRELLKKAELQDEEQQIQNLLTPENSGQIFPVDSNFIQSHAFSG